MQEWNEETLNNHIGRKVNVLTYSLRRACDKAVAPYGISGKQIRLISFIYQADKVGRAIYQKDVEQFVGTRRSSVSSMLQGLEREGFIIREGDPQDGRLKKLSLTKKALEVHEESRKAIEAIEAKMRESLDSQEWQITMSSLDKLIQCVLNEGQSEVVDGKETI